MAKAKVVTKTKVSKKVDSLQVPALLGLALLLTLLCIFPWVSDQDGSTEFRALQVSLALILAMAAGICLGWQLATRKK